MGLWPPAPTIPPPVMISSISRIASGMGESYSALGAPSSVTIGVAGFVQTTPFLLTEKAVIQKLYWYNGSVIAGNVDCGVYDPQFQLIASTGSTVQTGTVVVQSVDVPDFELDAGLYYMAIATSSASAALIFMNNSALDPLAAVASQSYGNVGVFPLPATLSSLIPTNALPVYGLATRLIV